MADFATVCRGAVTVPIYTTYRAPQVAELLADSGAAVAFAGGPADLEKLRVARATCPELRRIVSMGADGSAPDVMTLSALAASGEARRAGDPGEFDREADAVRPGDLATLIYTSGTTGEPKGTMLTHGNFASDVQAALPSLPLRDSDVALSFLPLSHVFERMLEYSYFARAIPIAYVESIDRISEALREVRPTIFGAVPRVYEKVRERVLDSVEGSSSRGARRDGGSLSSSPLATASSTRSCSRRCGPGSGDGSASRSRGALRSAAPPPNSSGRRESRYSKATA
jgi:long-chain acyl-CoA synthetase